MPYLLIVSNFIMLGIFVWRLPTLPPQVPLFASNPWGESRLGELWMIFLLPLLMNVFFFLNLYILRKFFNEIDYVKKVIYYVNLFVMASFLFIFIKIILQIS
jgi:hypothetical protein